MPFSFVLVVPGSDFLNNKSINQNSLYNGQVKADYW